MFIQYSTRISFFTDNNSFMRKRTSGKPKRMKRLVNGLFDCFADLWLIISTWFANNCFFCYLKKSTLVSTSTTTETPRPAHSILPVYSSPPPPPLSIVTTTTSREDECAIEINPEANSLPHPFTSFYPAYTHPYFSPHQSALLSPPPYIASLSGIHHRQLHSPHPSSFTPPSELRIKARQPIENYL